jgi:hypothetical protein
VVVAAPLAEYSQSMRCALVSPGAGTRLPTNHFSSVAKYSVIVTRVSQVGFFSGYGEGGVVAAPASAGASRTSDATAVSAARPFRHDFV